MLVFRIFWDKFVALIQSWLKKKIKFLLVVTNTPIDLSTGPGHQWLSGFTERDV